MTEKHLISSDLLLQFPFSSLHDQHRFVALSKELGISHQECQVLETSRTKKGLTRHWIGDWWFVAGLSEA